MFLGKRSQFISDVWGYKEESFPIKYLGLPIKHEKLKKQDWNPLFDGLESKLDNWKSKLLSLGGSHPTQCSVVNYPLHYMSFFVLPTWVRDKIDRTRKRFLWAALGR